MHRCNPVAGMQCSLHEYQHRGDGTALVEAGVDLRTVQELMRHASIQSTQIYTQVTDKRRAEGLDRLNPWAA